MHITDHGHNAYMMKDGCRIKLIEDSYESQAPLYFAQFERGRGAIKDFTGNDPS